MAVADVVVVGAGIVGASVAYHAAAAGAAVVLLDATLPAGAVTGASFAWIGGPGGRDPVDGSTTLRRAAMGEWRRLEREVPGVKVRWSGSLAWGEHALRDLEELGPDERLVDEAHVRRLEPNLHVPPQRAVLKSSDGSVDPVTVTEALVQAARDRGAEVRLGTSVTRLRVRGDAVVGVETSSGPDGCRTVVLAAGAGTPLLCAPLGVDLPVAPSPALLLRFTAPPGLVRTLVASPQFEARQSGGCLLLAGAYAGEVTQGELRRTGQEAARWLAATFQGGEEARLLDVRVGQRPMPSDGLPVIGPLPGHSGVYLAVMHSGITLGPAVGRQVAAELVEGNNAVQLSGVRPERLPLTTRPHHAARPAEPSR